uniref:GCN5-related N-acetyltransferase n=1 Tax=uncultured bacterium A1Q1_fos_2140 TaxID=1256565 RepID=L7VWY4_9BACT|nr:GCN5-related N-acetyltransferase [uncultured bacterium A1Q1_fos_2140]
MNTGVFDKKFLQISTDNARMDLNAIHAFLQGTYWGKNRSLDAMKKAMEHSLCFGLFDAEKQIGFARAVSDYTFFTYIFDVYILDEYQGQGLGKWFCQSIADDPRIRETVLVLASKEADFYKKLGFCPHANPERILVRPCPGL